jgi:hypothetical protein
MIKSNFTLAVRLLVIKFMVIIAIRAVVAVVITYLDSSYFAALHLRKLTTAEALPAAS